MTDFIDKVVVTRQKMLRPLVGGSGSWRIPWSVPGRGSGQTCLSLLLFLQCREDLTPKGSGVLADPGLMDEEFRKAWLLFFL